MTFLPVVDRELRVAARRRMTFYSRLLAAILSIVVLGVIVARSSIFIGIGMTAGSVAFKALAGLALLYCFLEGLRKTSDCLSEEKREGTLGLLLLTDLSGWDIVLGKLAANSLNSAYGLLACFPIMAIALSMGGVRGTEFWRTVLVLVHALAFSLAFGIGCSARNHDAYKAAVATLLGLALVAGGSPLLDEVWLPNRTGPEMAVFSLVSPAYTAMMAYESNYLRSPEQFWKSLILVHGFTWILLWRASLFIGRHWQDDPKPSSWSLRVCRWRAVSAKNRLHEIWSRKCWLETNPALWLGRHFQGNDAWFWLPAVLAAAAFLHQWGIGFPQQSRAPGLGLITGITTILFCLTVAARASRCLVESRVNGGLELLFCTPLTPAQFIEGQRLALRPVLMRLAFAGAIVYLASYLVQDLAVISQGNANSLDFFLITQTGQLIVYFTDLMALSWMALWLAATARNLNQAVAKAFIYVILLPAFVMILFQVLRGGVSISGFHPLAWSLDSCLQIGKDMVFVNYARKRLYQRLRLIASEGPHTPQ